MVSRHVAVTLDEALNAAGFLVDPHPTYRRLHAEGPVHWSGAWSCWVLSSYAAVTEALRLDGQALSTRGRVTGVLRDLSERERPRLATLEEHYSGGLMFSDPPAHTRLRRVVNKILTPRSVASVRSRIHSIATELMDGMDPRQVTDLMESFALALPVAVVAEVLGIPLSRPAVDEWIAHSQALAGPPVTVANALIMDRSLQDVRGFLLDVARSKQRNPTNDVISQLASAMAAGAITQNELLSTCTTFVIGAYQTTAGLISSGVYHLLRDRTQLELLRSRRAPIEHAVEEFVRYESPARQIARVVASDIEIAGHRVAARDHVVLLLGAANRDDQEFADASRFDVRRHPNRHIGYAIGAHHCVGAPLARLEGAVAVRSLIDRFPRIELGDMEDQPWLPSLSVRLLRRLPVILDDSSA